VLQRFWRSGRSAVRRYFVAGILAFAPIGITIWAIASIVQYLDNLFLPKLLALLFPSVQQPPSIPFVGALFTFLVILLFGVIARHLFGWELVQVTERLLQRVPVARNIYTAVKQLFEAIFRSDTGTSFNRVVLVEYPRKGVWAIAFTTGPARGVLQDVSEEPMVNVFVPTTPNPTSGFFLLVPEHDLKTVDLTVEQAFKLIMSAGLVAPEPSEIADTAGIPAGAADRTHFDAGAGPGR